MMSSKLLAHLSPEPIVQQAMDESREAFASRYEGLSILMVQLDDPSGELAAGLAAAATGSDDPVQPNLHAMAYHTVVQTQVKPASPAWTRAHADQVAAVRRRIEQTPCFIVPLRKRDSTQATYADRISVGRARNKDVVLRHRSVSKFHAWFERDESGATYVADAGSKNGVSVNDESLTPRALVPIATGDDLKLGGVEAFLTEAATLWDALHD